jgi:hypothetical protein
MSKKAAKSDNDEEDYGSFDDENDGEGKVVEEKESVQANAVHNESASLQGRQLSAEEEEAAERKRMQEAMRRVQRAETKLRELSFREEESRVREGVDGFVPHPVTELTPAIKELDEERERLARVEAAAANRDLERKTNSEKRDIRVEQMAAAESIQRIVRGHQGRIRFRVIKKQKELDESGVSRLPPLHPALGSTAELLAHDVPESGGDQVGEDDGMGDMDEHEYLNGSRKAKLPFLRQRTFERERPLSATSSVSSTASSDLDVDDNIPAFQPGGLARRVAIPSRSSLLFVCFFFTPLSLSLFFLYKAIHWTVHAFSTEISQEKEPPRRASCGTVFSLSLLLLLLVLLLFHSFFNFVFSSSSNEKSPNEYLFFFCFPPRRKRFQVDLGTHFATIKSTTYNKKRV